MGVTTTTNSATTYVPIATYTLASSASTVTFGSGGTLPQTYTDLVLVFNGTSSANSNGCLVFNSDSGSHYSNTYVLGNGSSASSGTGPNTSVMKMFYPNTTSSTAIINLMNYSNTTTYKTGISRHSSTGNFALANVGLWRGSTGSSTEAITSITVSVDSGTFSAGSTFTLYGIKAA
jgi:hypothetical protein